VEIIYQEDPVKSNTETMKETTTPEINSSTLTVTGLIQKKTGNKPKQSTEMRKWVGSKERKMKWMKERPAKETGACS